LVGLTALLLPRIRPNTLLEEQALAQARAIIERWGIRPVRRVKGKD
jgi:hypothetical protein